MDKFLDNWLPNIVVNAVFYLIQHAREVAAVTGLAYAASRLHKVFAARKASSGELTFDASTGSLRGVAISNSTAVAHLTPQTRCRRRDRTYRIHFGIATWRLIERCRRICAFSAITPRRSSHATPARMYSARRCSTIPGKSLAPTVLQLLDPATCTRCALRHFLSTPVTTE